MTDWTSCDAAPATAWAACAPAAPDSAWDASYVRYVITKDGAGDYTLVLGEMGDAAFVEDGAGDFALTDGAVGSTVVLMDSEGDFHLLSVVP